MPWSPARTSKCSEATGQLPVLPAILLLALALRLCLFLSAIATPARFLYVPDSYEYVSLAQNLITGHGFSVSESPPFTPDLRRTPLYPALLAGILWATNDNLTGAVVVNIVFSVATVALTYYLARQLFSAPAAVWASLLLAIDFTSIAYSNLLLTEAVFTALVCVGLLWVVRCLEHSRPSYALISGIFLGLAALCRPIGVFLAAAMLPVFAWSGRAYGIRKRFVLYLLLNLSALLLIGLWLLRNYLTFGGMDISSVGAVNLYFHRAAAIQALIEHSDEATVRARWEREFARLSTGWSEEQQIAWLNARALEMIGEHPSEYAIVYTAGLLRMFGSERDSLADLLGWEHTSQATSLLVSIGWAQLLAVYALAIVGLVAAWRKTNQRRAAILLLTCFSYFVVTAGPEAYSRFRVPVMPVISVVAGYGLMLSYRTLGPRPLNV